MLTLDGLSLLGLEPGAAKSRRKYWVCPVDRSDRQVCHCGGRSIAGVYRRRFWWPSHQTKVRGTACHVSRNGLVLFLADLLAITFASERFFYTLLLAWLQIKRVALNFLDDVFSLHLALKAAQGILKGFAFLNSNLCQEKYTSKQSRTGCYQDTPFFSGIYDKLAKNRCQSSRGFMEAHCRISFEGVPPPRGTISASLLFS